MGRALRISLVLTMLAACGEQTPKKKRSAKGGDKFADSLPAENGETAGGSTPASQQGRHVVMVIDDGFDTSLSLFKDKLKESYTVSCTNNPPEFEDFVYTANYTALKQFYIDQYSSKEADNCTVKKGYKFDAGTNFNNVPVSKDEWNKAILEKTAPKVGRTEFEKTQSIIGGEAAGKNYHGTNVASIIAYQNPNVELVFVNLELLSPGSDVTQGGPCPTQGGIDQWVAAHEEQEVISAYESAVLDGITSSLVDIAEKQRVTLINMSFGSLPLKALTGEYKKSGCGNLDFREVYRVQGEIDALQNDYRRKNDSKTKASLGKYLGIQAAGNEGERIDSRSEALDCSDRPNDLILIGSYDYKQSRSKFSNYGNCVDFYGLGEWVVTYAPNEYLNMVAGTSFSAPMVVRYLTQVVKPGTDSQDTIRELEKRATNKNLKGDSFPSELAWESTQKIADFSLIEEGSSATPLTQRVSRDLARKIKKIFH